MHKFMICCMLFGALCTGIVVAQSNVTVNEESGSVYRDGLNLFKQKNYDEAVGKFREAYEVDDRNLNALFAEGLALSRLGRNEEAAERFRAVLAIDPAHEKALKMLPSVLTDAGDLDDAYEAYDHGIAAMPDSSFFYLGKAVAFLKVERYKDAIPLLEKAAGLDTKNIDILVRLMFAYREYGDMDKAYETARAILGMDATHAQARVIAADYLREHEQYEEALPEYELATRDIETKAYAEHYIEVINQILEEIEIEREYQARQQASGNGG